MVLDMVTPVIKSSLLRHSNQDMVKDLQRGKYQKEIRKLILMLEIPAGDHQTLYTYLENQIWRKKKLPNRN